MLFSRRPECGALKGHSACGERTTLAPSSPPKLNQMCNEAGSSSNYFHLSHDRLHVNANLCGPKVDLGCPNRDPADLPDSPLISVLLIGPELHLHYKAAKSMLSLTPPLFSPRSFILHYFSFAFLLTSGFDFAPASPQTRTCTDRHAHSLLHSAVVSD